MALVLSRKIGDTVVIGDAAVIVTVLAIDRGKVKLGIEAAPTIIVNRGEVHDRIKEEQHGKSAK